VGRLEHHQTPIPRQQFDCPRQPPRPPVSRPCAALRRCPHRRTSLHAQCRPTPKAPHFPDSCLTSTGLAPIDPLAGLRTIRTEEADHESSRDVWKKPGRDSRHRHRDWPRPQTRWPRRRRVPRRGHLGARSLGCGRRRKCSDRAHEIARLADSPNGSSRRSGSRSSPTGLPKATRRTASARHLATYSDGSTKSGRSATRRSFTTSTMAPRNPTTTPIWPRPGDIVSAKS
jgi:hypothetical protein